MIKSVTIQKNPLFPQGCVDRLLVKFEDGTSMTHVFGSKFKDAASFNFMVMIYKNLGLK